ncbi:hypothetical protein Ancab_031926, partial [Ancistrocladus abbreviatus]
RQKMEKLFFVLSFLFAFLTNFSAEARFAPLHPPYSVLPKGSVTPSRPSGPISGRPPSGPQRGQSRCHMLPRESAPPSWLRNPTPPPAITEGPAVPSVWASHP